MEYSNFWLGIIAIIIALFWSMDFFSVFKKSDITLPQNGKNRRNIIRYIVFLLGVIGWLYIAFASTGPRIAKDFVPSDIEVNDIYLVVDVSRSMKAEDLKPNRLEVAKEKLREFAALRPTDRLGVIIFSEKVFTMLPLTTDPNLIDQIISRIKIGFLGSGTNIGDALGLAVARAQKSKTKNKVIVLLTDGVNNVGNMTPMQAAELAKEYKIKVYTIGLGKTKAKLPIGKDVFGKKQYQNIPGGSIDLKTLNEISEMTGGRSYMAGSENSLEEILEDIQKLEKTKIKSEAQVIYEELFFKYLAIGVLLLGIAEILRVFVLREVL